MKVCETSTFFQLKVYERGTFSVKMVYKRGMGLDLRVKPPHIELYRVPPGHGMQKAREFILG